MSRLDVDIAGRMGDFPLEANFTGETGGITALYGRSGAGKTSVVNMIAGLAAPDRGRIALGDRVLFDAEKGIDVPPEKRRIGYVFQEDRLFPHLSVRSNLEYGRKRTAPDDRHTGFDSVIEMLGIGDLLERRPHRLSGGEKQRVAIGRALLASPDLLLMDEPLASLDLARKAEILPFIERLRESLGLPIVYVSHATEEVVRLADTVALMADGRTVASGPVEDVMSRLDLRPLTGRYEAGAVLAVTVARHDESDNLSELTFEGGRLTVPRVDLELGQHLRVRVRARDVALALERPAGISILNIFKGPVLEIAEAGPAQMDVLLDISEDGGTDDCRLWARITRRSARDMDLKVGREVHALVKAVAIDRHSLGL